MRKNPHFPSPYRTRLGPLAIALDKPVDHHDQSSIRIRFASDRPSLLEPTYGEFGKEPSTVDKLLAIIKKALQNEGMNMLGDPNELRFTPPDNMPANRVGLALREFSGYHPGNGDEGVTIYASNGAYGTTFNAANMLDETKTVIEDIAHHFEPPETITGPALEEVIDDVYMAMEVHERSLGQALENLKSTDAPVASVDPRQKMRDAITKAIPAGVGNETQRSAIVTAIMNGIFDANPDSRWEQMQPTDTLRGTPYDPLRQQIAALLKDTIQSLSESEKLCAFFAGEICDGIYAQLNAGHSGVRKSAGGR